MSSPLGPDFKIAFHELLPGIAVHSWASARTGARSYVATSLTTPLDLTLEVGGDTEGWVHPGRLMCKSLVYGQQSFSGQESPDLLDATIVDVSPEFESSARGYNRIQYLDSACPE